MVHQCGYPMGPLELIDMTGIDIAYHVRKVDDVDISPLMAEKVEKGKYGRKSGKGHYDYEDGDGRETVWTSIRGGLTR